MKKLNNIKTDKDVFDYITSFLFNQGDRSIKDDNTCAYRGLDNMKCAIGCMIEDRFYHETLEDCTPYDTNVQNAIRLSVPNYELNEQFLSNMQYTHDQFNPQYWEVQFSRFQFSPEGKFEGVKEDSFTHVKAEI